MYGDNLQGAWAAHLVSLSRMKSPTGPGHSLLSLCHDYKGKQGPNPQNCLLLTDEEQGGSKPVPGRGLL